MISFQPTEEQESIRDSVQSFAAGVMRKLARECDETASVPDSFLDQAWELGLTSTQIPEQYGGYGAHRSPITNAILLEELGYGDAALALAAVAPSLFAYAVLDQGTEAQKSEFLPRLCGERYTVSTLALAEPTPDFDALHPRTTATTKDGGFVLHGKKTFVPMGDRAEHFLVVARNGARHDAFIVTRDAAGVSVRSPEKNLGLRGLPTATVELKDVMVDAQARLGGDSGADVSRLLNHTRVALAAVCTGLCRAVLEFCVPYAKERVAFDEPIARKQSIAFRLADMHIEIESLRWLTWKAASQLERGRDATRSARLASSYASEKSMWIADNGVQVLGGHGYIREHPVEMWYRHARTLGVLEGAASV